MKYKKIWSINPDSYIEIEAGDAISGYARYLEYVTQSTFGSGDLREAKTITEWLSSEI